MNRSTRWATTLLVSVLLSACSGGSDEPEATAPPPDASTTTSTSDAPPESAPTTDQSDTTTDTDVETTTTTKPETTTSAPSTATVPETTTTEPAPTLVLADDVGPRTDTLPVDDPPALLADAVAAPGTFTQISEMEFVYLPTEPDPDDRDVITPGSDDLEILTAYARARAALLTQTSQIPVPSEPNAAVREAFADGGADLALTTLQEYRQTETSVGFLFGLPNVYRPFVLEAPRSETEALVWDCAILTSLRVRPDGTPTVADAAPVAREGIAAQMERVDGVWKVSTGFDLEERACS